MIKLKVVALLTSKPAADGDEEKDEGGFGSSLAMMPLGAAGGVVWGLLSSIGAGIANVSSTFKFVKYEQEHYYGSLEEAVWLVGTSLFYQGFSQVCCYFFSGLSNGEYPFFGMKGQTQIN